jgi:hypothetical protein
MIIPEYRKSAFCTFFLLELDSHTDGIHFGSDVLVVRGQIVYSAKDFERLILAAALVKPPRTFW